MHRPISFMPLTGQPRCRFCSKTRRVLRGLVLWWELIVTREGDQPADTGEHSLPGHGQTKAIPLVYC